MSNVTILEEARLRLALRRLQEDMRKRFAGHPPAFSWLVTRKFADALEQAGMVREKDEAGRFWLVDPSDATRRVGVLTAREEAQDLWEEAHAPPGPPAKPAPTEGVAPGAWWHRP